MKDEYFDKVRETLTLLIGFGSLCLNDNSVLRSFLGTILLLVLFNDLRKRLKFFDRIIISMSMAFAVIIACSYFLTLFLKKHGWILHENIILLIML